MWKHIEARQEYKNRHSRPLAGQMKSHNKPEKQQGQREEI
jgi:hypothetical protein